MMNYLRPGVMILLIAATLAGCAGGNSAGRPQTVDRQMPAPKEPPECGGFISLTQLSWRYARPLRLLRAKRAKR